VDSGKLSGELRVHLDDSLEDAIFFVEGEPGDEDGGACQPGGREGSDPIQDGQEQGANLLEGKVREGEGEDLL